MKNGGKSGVYKLVIGDNIYVGSTINLKGRFLLHKSRLRLNKHPNKLIQTLYNQLGEQKLEFIILEYCFENLREREKYYIDNLNSNLNICRTTKNPIKLKGHTKKTKEKISKIKKEYFKNQPIEFFEKLSLKSKLCNTKPFLGKHHTEENKKNARKRYIKNILCINTNEIFETQKDIAKKYGLKQGHISENLSGKRNKVKGYSFKYVK